MDKELQNFKIEMASFTATVKEWMLTTSSYRKELCDKITKIDIQLSNHITVITDKLNELPCRDRAAWYLGVQKQLKWIWRVLGAVFSAIVIEWVKKR